MIWRILAVFLMLAGGVGIGISIDRLTNISPYSAITWVEFTLSGIVVVIGAAVRDFSVDSTPH